MNTYDIYFEIYGKRMVVRDVKADSQEEAKTIVRNEIKFDKIEETSPYKEPSLGLREIFDDLMNTLDSFGKKK